MKFANFSDYHSDVARELNGARLSLGKGRALIVRRSGTRNRAFVAALSGIDPNETAAQIDVIASTLIVGWEGVQDEDGNEIPFSVEACKELLHFAPDLLDTVAQFATTRGNFAADELRKDSDAVKTP